MHASKNEHGNKLCGPEGTRTPDPLHAMQVRYQLRHRPGASRVLHLVRCALPRRVLQCHHWAVSPQLLELIKTAFVFVENVDNEFAKIQQHPATLRFAFAPKQLVSGEVQVVFDAVCDGRSVAFTSTGNDQKNIGDC
jgi:hypothetical protein